MSTTPIAPSALKGVRVIEMGQLIAGPFAGKTLGEFGADVTRRAPGGATRATGASSRTAPLVAAIAQQRSSRLDLRAMKGRTSRVSRIAKRTS
jgi:crotonobetainyl-CoA:carnitine CoA-transferase CaiB-like acyl-CoA transferase